MGPWKGETELSESLKAMAHVIDGIPDQENKSCEVYRESTGRDVLK